MFIVRATGIPYTSTVSDICSFFGDCEVVGGEKGVHLPVAQDGRPNGEAFVLMANESEVEKALQLNNKYLRDRYVGVRQSSKEEMDFALRFGEYGNVRECMVAEWQVCDVALCLPHCLCKSLLLLASGRLPRLCDSPQRIALVCQCRRSH